MFVKVVLQGEFGAQLSRFYKSTGEARQFGARIDALEIEVTKELSQFMGDVWPELEVMMFFLWPCSSETRGQSLRYIQTEKLLEASTCLEPDAFLSQSIDGRAHMVFRSALIEFAKGFRKYHKSVEELDSLRERLFPEALPRPAAR